MKASRFVSAVAVVLVSCAPAPPPSPGGPDDRGGRGGLEELRSVRVNGVELHYVERGRGEPMVFVHGSLADYREWGQVIDDLSTSFRTIAYSRRYNHPNTTPFQDGSHSAMIDVEDLGANVTAFHIGDEVYGDLSDSGFGAFAEYVCAPATALARKPAGITFEQAAAVPQAGMLAVQGLIDAGRMRPGQKLLLNGAGGGVGTFALQLVSPHDVEVTVVDKPGKLGMLRAMGADHVVNYLEEDFTKGEAKYDLILDVKTNRSPSAYLRVLTPDGV